MMLETRVGCMGVDVLKSELETYIRAYTVDKRYVRDVKYLLLYQQFNRYLRSEER